jgi:Ulp1 family protease
VKYIDGPGNTTLANQLDIGKWTLIKKTPDLPQQDNGTDCGVSWNLKTTASLTFDSNICFT